MRVLIGPLKATITGRAERRVCLPERTLTWKGNPTQKPMLVFTERNHFSYLFF